MGLALRIPLWIATLVLLLLAARAGAADHCAEISAQLTSEQVTAAREWLSWNPYAISEKLLDFEQADVRRPVVLGELHDGAEKPPPEATEKILFGQELLTALVQLPPTPERANGRYPRSPK